MRTVLQKRRVFVGAAGTLLVALIVLLLGLPVDPFWSARTRTGQPFADRQAAAMRPGFRGAATYLTDAPRYVITATVAPDAGTIDGTLTVRYTNTAEESLSELVFRLLPNATTIYGGGSLTVETVHNEGQPREVHLSQDRTVLRVSLSRPLPPGETTSVEVTFTAQVPSWTRQGYGIFNRARGVTMLAGWYPILTVYDDGWQTPEVPPVGDAMLSGVSFYDVTLLVPAGHSVVATGSAIDVTEENDASVWHFVSGPVREFAVAISDRFVHEQTAVGDVTVNLYALPATRPATSIETARGIARNALATYDSQFGPYPYAEFDVVEGFVTLDGYEFPGMVAIDSEARIQGPRDDYRYLVAHETAHQWWYGLVGSDSVREPWLDEALATYSTIIYFEEADGRAKANTVLREWERTYGPRTVDDPPITSETYAFGEWDTYNAVVYYHGAFFLNELRQETGDRQFVALLQRYLSTYRYERATTSGFLDVAQKTTDQDLCRLFERWFEQSSVCR